MGLVASLSPLKKDVLEHMPMAAWAPAMWAQTLNCGVSYSRDGDGTHRVFRR